MRRISADLQMAAADLIGTKKRVFWNIRIVARGWISPGILAHSDDTNSYTQRRITGYLILFEVRNIA